MEWRQVPGFGDRYEATECGRVRRLWKTGERVEITQTYLDRGGFARVNVDVNGRQKRRKVRLAQMVALAWVPKPTPSHRFAYPLNGNPLDTRAENLAWKQNPTGDSKGHKRGVPGTKGGDFPRRALDVLVPLQSGGMSYSEMVKVAGLDRRAVMRLCPFLREMGLLTHTGNEWLITPAGEAAIPQLYECHRERSLLKMLKLATKDGRGEARRKVSLRDRYTVLSRGSCACCGKTVADHGVTLHVDHIVPVAQGGGNELANLQALCWHCNLGKSDRLDSSQAA